MKNMVEGLSRALENAPAAPGTQVPVENRSSGFQGQQAEQKQEGRPGRRSTVVYGSRYLSTAQHSTAQVNAVLFTMVLLPRSVHTTPESTPHFTEQL